MDIGIVGGGASGMFLASKLKKSKNVSITLIERNSKLGKKLLLTGNGKCNFTNGNFENDSIYNSEFAYNIYKMHGKEELLSFMRDIGIEPKIEIHKGEKYYYPNTNKSTSVYYALLDRITANGVKILYDTFINDIKVNDGRFVLLSDRGEFYFDKLIIATGGNTCKNTGSDGNFYKIIEKLGHNIIRPLPALCGFSYDDSNLLMIKGVRIDAKVSAIVYNLNNIEREFTEFGEVQFTQNGISGIPIMNLSRFVNRYIDDNRRVDLSIDFNCNDEISNSVSIINYLNERKEKIYYKNSRDFLCGFIPDELASVIINRCDIKDKLVANLNDNEIRKLAKEITNFKITNVKMPSIDNAQITVGGVDLKDIDDKSLESKLVKNMYLIGEVLNVDGKCGGYNLQFAYSSAATVARQLT